MGNDIEREKGRGRGNERGGREWEERKTGSKEVFFEGTRKGTGGKGEMRKGEGERKGKGREKEGREGKSQPYQRP